MLNYFYNVLLTSLLGTFVFINNLYIEYNASS